MLHRNIQAGSGLRLLDDTELEVVSGGTDEGEPIIVTGTKYPDPWIVSIAAGDLWMYPELFSDSGEGGFGDYGDGGGDFSWFGPPGELIDTDGDGEGDTIVVSVPGEDVEAWNDFAADMTAATQWYITISAWLAGPELAAMEALLAAKIGERMASVVAGAAGAGLATATEDTIHAFWFEYAKNITLNPALTPP